MSTAAFPFALDALVSAGWQHFWFLSYHFYLSRLKRNNLTAEKFLFTNHMTSSRHQTNLHHSVRIASSKRNKHTSTESTTSLLPARRRTLPIINLRPSQLTPQRLHRSSLPLPLLSNPPHLLTPQPTTSSLLILASLLLFFSLLFSLCFLLSHFSCKKCLVVFFSCLAVGTEGVCG